MRASTVFLVTAIAATAAATYGPLAAAALPILLANPPADPDASPRTVLSFPIFPLDLSIEFLAPLSVDFTFEIPLSNPLVSIFVSILMLPSSAILISCEKVVLYI